MTFEASFLIVRSVDADRSLTAFVDSNTNKIFSWAMTCDK